MTNTIGRLESHLKIQREIDAHYLNKEIDEINANNKQPIYYNKNSLNRLVLENYLSNVTMCLLKLRYQPMQHNCDWEQQSIQNGRHQIQRRLKINPSLQPIITEIVDNGYPSARRNASLETGLPLIAFPGTCPFTIEQITSNYWPDQNSAY